MSLFALIFINLQYQNNRKEVFINYICKLLFYFLILFYKLNLQEIINKQQTTLLQKKTQSILFIPINVKMGHKGRKNNNRIKKKDNDSKQNHNQPNNNYQKASEQQLQIECLQLYELLTNKTKILKQEKLDYCYIISTKWLEDWKDYVGYHNLQEGDEKKHKKIGKKHPGKINFDIVINSKGFYHIPMEQYDYLNTVINEKKQKDDDYIAIAKQIWEVFASKYDHIEIKRPKRVTKKGSVLYDGNLLQLQVVIVNFNDKELIENIVDAKQIPKRDLDQQFSCDKMQIATLWQVQDLRKFIEVYSEQIYEESQVKVWKIQGFATVGMVQRALWNGIHQKQSQIRVPCRQLTQQKYKDLDLDQFLKSYYSLVIQIGKPHLEHAQVPNPLEGYCEQCVKKKSLSVYCLCEQMFYCSEECRIVDQVWHQKVCKLTFESQDDQEYQKKKINVNKEGLPTIGLNNLGNTCYMNSVLQSLVSLQEITSYFSQNKFEKQVDVKEFEQHKCRLLNKYSKFIKKLYQQKQALSPWSLKGQINYFLAPFKGFKQHDANDFLINFVTAINEQLLKKQIQSYNHLFSENLVGQFTSFIKCPQCNVQIQNEEIFTQLTLPIKQKKSSKAQSTTTYVIYENARKIIRGKCLVMNSWQDMRKDLQLKDSCLLMATRQAQHVLDVDQEEEPEKILKKLKRQLIYYPNCSYTDTDQLFSVIPITQKNMYGQRMKNPYGYPAIINMDPQLNTLGSLYVQILKHFCPPQIYEDAIKLKSNYFKQVQEVISNKKKLQQVETKSQTQASQKDVDKKQQGQEHEQALLQKLIQESANKQLQALLKKNKISVFINDLKRQRNICQFCKKKCSGCEVPIKFSMELKEYLQQKGSKDVNFEILLQDKIQQEKIQKDIVKASGDTTIKDCMQLFTQPQQLDQQNAWWCQVCQDLRLAYKQLTIKKLPNFLIIHLNRFKSQGDKKVKNSQPIQYQQYQTFADLKYRLVSSIIHEGSTQGGHYWSISLRNDKYYIFNDNKVNVTQKMCNKSAYILIYRKC